MYSLFLVSWEVFFCLSYKRLVGQNNSCYILSVKKDKVKMKVFKYSSFLI